MKWAVRIQIAFGVLLIACVVTVLIIGALAK